MAGRLYPDFVFFLANDWDSHHRPKGRFRSFASRIMSSGSKVLCINTPVCPLTTPWLHPRKWRDWISTKNHVKSIGENLFLYTPFVLVHDMIAVRHPALTYLNRRLMTRNVRRVLENLDFAASKRVSWIDDPFGVLYFGVARETWRVYECRDNYAEIPGLSSRQKSLVRRLETVGFAEADLVFCTSISLYEAAKDAAPRAFLLPNAADTELLMRAQDAETPVADFMLVLPHPIVGYLGTIHEYTDIELMLQIAVARPHWTIVMIGPEQQPSFSRSTLFTRFRSMPNVKLTGWVKREELPGYCKAFDVCVIPYRIDSAFNWYVNPDKLYEYTAMGKPVVSTDLPESRLHRDIIKIANTPEEFIQAIEEWLSEDSPEKVKERLRMARENSWDRRVEQVIALLEEHL